VLGIYRQAAGSGVDSPAARRAWRGTLTGGRQLNARARRRNLIEDADLFVALAQIAGVFVGFGALISLTRRSEIEASELGRIRGVVTIGLSVIVAALIPVGLGRYGVSGHSLWSICSLIFLLLAWVVIIVALRRPDTRELMIAQARANPVTAGFFWLFLEVPIQLPLILIVLGPYPDLEAAFYTTALVLNLFEAAFLLAQIVYSQVGPPN
jgi:hypothetical protein